MDNKRIKVLIADDDIMIQLAHRMALEATGRCEVIIANDGAEAIRKAQEGVDLILMDFNMPIMDGIEATIQIRAIEALSDVTIIGVTSNTDALIHQRAKTAGMNDVVVKPVLKHMFERILASCVKESAYA